MPAAEKTETEWRWQGSKQEVALRGTVPGSWHAGAGASLGPERVALVGVAVKP